MPDVLDNNYQNTYSGYEDVKLHVASVVELQGNNSEILKSSKISKDSKEKEIDIKNDDKGPSRTCKEDYQIVVITKQETNLKNKYLPRPIEEDDYDQRRMLYRKSTEDKQAEINSNPEHNENVTVNDVVDKT
jgi:hypothetical protein